MWLVNAFCFLLFFITISKVNGENCQTLDGTWYNELGSQLKLQENKDGNLTGLYFPKNSNEFEIACGQSEKFEVIGSTSFNQSNAVFSFSSIAKGNFVKSWIGQCLMRDGVEVLYTSWMLRQSVESCAKREQATNIGQSFFTRTAVPLEDLRKDDANKDSDEKDKSSDCCKYKSKKHSSSPAVNRGCSILTGGWCNELGSNMTIKTQENMIISGEYRTAVERSNGSAGTMVSALLGVAIPTDSGTVFSMHVIWNNGTSSTVWIGQCFLCGKNQIPTLTTNWLLRIKVNTNKDNWKALLYGEDVFTRCKQNAGDQYSSEEPSKKDKDQDHSEDKEKMEF